MKDVVCVGIAVQDVIFPLEHLPDGPGKNHTASRVEVGGGVAANAAVAVSKLGGKSRLVSALGDDLAGKQILDDLQAANVDTSGVVEMQGSVSPLSAVIVDSAGERMIVNHTDPTLFADAPTPRHDAFTSASAVLCDVRWPRAAEEALSWAASSSVPGILDLDVGNRETERLIELASHIVFSADALEAAAGTQDPEAGLQAMTGRTEALLAVTIGDAGTVWLDEGRIRRTPSFDVDVVDTTGAGDVYHGAFALALAEGVDHIEDAVRFASAAAAITCTTFGGRSGIPNRAQVEALMKAQL